MAHYICTDALTVLLNNRLQFMLLIAKHKPKTYFKFNTFSNEYMYLWNKSPVNYAVYKLNVFLIFYLTFLLLVAERKYMSNLEERKSKNRRKIGSS